MSGIKLTSDTLIGTPAGGNIEYNGQFFGTDSNNSRAQLERLVLETAKSATGTSVVFTGIPSWVNRITIICQQISLSGTDRLQVLLGDSGGIETTGYILSCTGITGASAFSFSSTAGIELGTPAAAASSDVIFTLCNITGNSWVASGILGSGTLNSTCVGSKTLSATLDRLQVKASGTNTFDNGYINILYEG